MGLWWPGKKLKLWGDSVLLRINPRVCLVNVLVIGSACLSDETLLSHLLVAARLLLAVYWKSDQIPILEEWFQKIRYILLMGNLTEINRLKNGDVKALESFKKSWA